MRWIIKRQRQSNEQENIKSETASKRVGDTDRCEDIDEDGFCRYLSGERNKKGKHSVTSRCDRNYHAGR